MEDIFSYITIALLLATVCSTVFRLVNLPPLLGYIAAGILLGPLELFHLGEAAGFHELSTIGIVLLLFLLGLESNISELRSVGKIALLIGSGQIVATTFLGAVLTYLFTGNVVESLLVGVALAFSSTIVIVKVLADKKDLQSIHGKLAIGILLVQDMVAIVVLILLTTLLGGEDVSFSPIDLGMIGLKAALLFGGVILLSQYVFIRVVNFFARSQELLFLFCIAWAFGFAWVTEKYAGFSMEIGGLLAGLSLANSTKSFHILTKLRSLRDFFIIIFFINLGMDLQFGNSFSVVFPVLLITLFVLVGKPVIVTGLLLFKNYRRRAAFLAGISLAQISEFSLIVLFTGKEVGVIDDTIITVMTLVAIITFSLSTLAMLHGHSLYRLLRPILRLVEPKHYHREQESIPLRDHIVIVGAESLGKRFFDCIDQIERQIVVVDFNPDVVEMLERKLVPVMFGDIADTDIQEKINLKEAALLFSTISDTEDNLILLHTLAEEKKNLRTIFVSNTADSSSMLYAAGADAVIHPKTILGDILGEALRRNDLSFIDGMANKRQEGTASP